MSKTYNNKTLEEYYTLYRTYPKNMSQTSFCAMFNIPRSTFNDYVRKRSEEIRPKTDIEAVVKIVRNEGQEVERELACYLDSRLEEMADFLAEPCDAARSKTKLAKCSRYFFWRTAMEYISSFRSNKDANIEKLFFAEKDSDDLKKIINIVDFIRCSLLFIEDSEDFELIRARKNLISTTLYEQRSNFTQDAYEFFTELLTIIGNSCYGMPKRTLPASFFQCENILKNAANCLLKKEGILNQDIICRIANETGTSYYETLAVIMDAQNEEGVFGRKVFPYDFLE